MTRFVTSVSAAAILAASALTVGTAEAADAQGGVALSRTNFRSAVATNLKPGQTLTVWADDARFAKFFAEVVAPRFAKGRGVAVTFAVKPAVTIAAELEAARKAGKASPADLVLVSDAKARGFVERGLVAEGVLDVLPHAADVDPAIANVADAVYTAGATVPFDIRQQVLAYDSTKVTPALIDTPASFASFASTNPARVGMVPGFQNKQLGASFLETLVVGLPVHECRSFIFDSELGTRGADAWASGECAAFTVNYMRMLKPTTQTKRTPAELLLALAKARVDVAVIDEADVVEAAQRGALPWTVRTTMMKTGQARQVTQLMVPVNVGNRIGALALADDLLSDTVQKAKLAKLGARSPRAAVMASASGPWFVPADRFGQATRARPVAVLTQAVAPRVALEAFDLALR